MCKDKKLVSIIIPAYNVENYIDSCIESILAQTYTAIEVLIVDDGSKDNTWSHIEGFMAQDERVRGFRRENEGVSATRNFALTQVNGEYIQFVDADDYLAKNGVERLVNAMESTGADWVNCQYNRVDEEGNLLEQYSFHHGFKDTSTQEARFNLIRDELLEYFIGYEVWNKLFRTSIIKEKGLAFDESCHIGEDLEFNTCYGFYANSINCIEDRLYYYLIRSDSAMAKSKALSNNFRQHLELSKGIESRFNEAFDKELNGKFYQLFYKLMIHGFKSYTAEEALQISKEVDDDFYKKYLSETLKHKDEFSKMFYPEISKLYYRYGLYIAAHLNKDHIREIYLKGYDLYRMLRKRETLREWKLS
ncbi:Glycosyl transferase family 2 [Pseudobutyrivibrio sp. 49]|uniref:glycosyltransferase family 2 protein n=1 Tax=Pseudobutyrivibrio sp. 49 TaxID=1855344 RepID=UPI0008925BD3|nr:glycosyltransferase family 2 protein [Pseudobutyrivibrio sp. 49]SDI03105.1 Glycosyl transferase family 2 [Pseudobutyrivibrio sp. 49]